MVEPDRSDVSDLVSDRPVLLVHGIWDRPSVWRGLQRKMRNEQFQHVTAAELRPNNGSAPLGVLAEQVQSEAQRLYKAGGEQPIDVVAFSMGSVVSRIFIQRLGGSQMVRRFVSISGPHAGTRLAYLGWRTGQRQLRPTSQLLSELNADVESWGQVEVTCLWTPLDLVVTPPRSAILPNARSEHRFLVPIHAWMLRSSGVHSKVISLLRSPESD